MNEKVVDLHGGDAHWRSFSGDSTGDLVALATQKALVVTFYQTGYVGDANYM